MDDNLTPRQAVKVSAARADGSIVEFMTMARCDTPIEVDYLRHGGILHMVLRDMASNQ